MKEYNINELINAITSNIEGRVDYKIGLGEYSFKVIYDNIVWDGMYHREWNIDVKTAKGIVQDVVNLADFINWKNSGEFDKMGVDQILESIELVIKEMPSFVFDEDTSWRKEYEIFLDKRMVFRGWK